MSTISQRSFAGGEIAPSLYARVDTVKYATGLRTCRNFMVMRHGGVANRPGTTFIGEVKDSSKVVRLITFAFNSSQTYCLEFGELYMRVIRDGAYVTLTEQNITAISNANPGVVTYSGSDTYTAGDEVYISGVTGAISAYVNGRNFKVGTVNTGANTFQLLNMDGTNFNTTSLGAYTSGGTIEEIYTISTPYYANDLSELQYVESADVISLVHTKYPPMELSRTGHASWTLSATAFAPSIAAPASPGTSGGTGGGSSSYVITSVASESFEESLPSSVTTIAQTASTGNPISVTWTNVTGAQEYNVYKLTNGVYGFIGVAGGTPFSDTGITADATDTAPTARNPFDLEAAVTITGITAASPPVVTAASHGYSDGDVIYIQSVSGMTQVNSLYFMVSAATSSTFALQDLGQTNIVGAGYTAYSSGGTSKRAGNYPGAVSYFQQRLMFANSKNDPEKCWASRSGQFKNYTISSPIQDDDAVTFTLAGRQVNEVKHLLDLGKLITLTSGGEWAVEGGTDGVLRPGEINPKQYSYNGSSSLSPILVAGNALYVQARGSIVRDFGFDYQVDGYRGNDLTIFSAHMFDQYSLLDWSYQQIPHSIIWIVRDDGTLLGLTYVREHQLVGWHRHDFDGTVENVCVVPEGSEDAVYVVIKRTINGATKRYVERVNSRAVNLIEDSIFVDAALTYDGRNSDSTHTMTLSGSGWTYTDTLTLTASSSEFSSSDVGNAIHLTGSDGTFIRFAITAYTSATVVSGLPDRTVPASMQAVATSDWTHADDELSGLWHLEGKDVSVFADGFVVANPNNESYVLRTVSNGAITLDKPYGVIHVGLPIIADVETLNMDQSDGETMADKMKIVSKLSIFVESSRGIWAGSEPPSDDDVDPLEGLTELKIRNSESYDEPIALQTGVVDINIQPEWNSNGRIFIRQVDPLPLSVLAVAPAGLFPQQVKG